MKKLTTKEWGKQFFFEWLVPKGATAYAVYSLAGILLALPQDGDAGAAAVNRLNKVFDLTSGKIFFILLIAIGVIWLLSLLVRSWATWKKIRFPHVLKFAYMNGLFATAFGVCAGMVLVPLSVALTFALTFPHADLGLTIYVCIAVVMFVGINAALHSAKLLDANPSHCVTYVIKLKPEFKGERRTETVDAIEQAVKDVSWVGTPATLLESDDGQVVLAIPVRLLAKFWSKNDTRRFDDALKTVEQNWSKAGHNWSRHVSTDLNKKVRSSCGKLPSGQVA
ncbi:hypothetical protein HFK83_23255 [Ralstonia pseudosolanacearum]|uniref:hypothetical protein n=1 Tax=Ralstonia pseudosolanacearum TaxID=1310165 RepID=UPI00036052A9|nr:hypothetical protein [Ralstonia pseudosolanacearum]MCK4125275.1 hypothetical protein [Ralstonia pseudosolanacearum]